MRLKNFKQLYKEYSDNPLTLSDKPTQKEIINIFEELKKRYYRLEKLYKEEFIEDLREGNNIYDDIYDDIKIEDYEDRGGPWFYWGETAVNIANSYVTEDSSVTTLLTQLACLLFITDAEDPIYIKDLINLDLKKYYHQDWFNLDEFENTPIEDGAQTYFDEYFDWYGHPIDKSLI